jgi:hypothetical protein
MKYRSKKYFGHTKMNIGLTGAICDIKCGVMPTSSS